MSLDKLLLQKTTLKSIYFDGFFYFDLFFTLKIQNIPKKSFFAQFLHKLILMDLKLLDELGYEPSIDLKQIMKILIQL